MDDSRERSRAARFRVDVGHHVGHSAGLPGGLARLQHRYHREGRPHGDFHSSYPKNANL